MNHILKTTAALALALLAGPFATTAAMTNSPASPAIDPAFLPGITLLKNATGFSNNAPGQSSSTWRPGLCLWVGVKVTDGSKQTICFVEMTTLTPPLTNAAGSAWTPPQHTNHFGWSRTNNVEYVSSMYPVRLRVF